MTKEEEDSFRKDVAPYLSKEELEEFMSSLRLDWNELTPEQQTRELQYFVKVTALSSK